jgi:hypothetical protein
VILSAASLRFIQYGAKVPQKFHTWISRHRHIAFTITSHQTGSLIVLMPVSLALGKQELNKRHGGGFKESPL